MRKLFAVLLGLALLLGCFGIGIQAAENDEYNALDFLEKLAPLATEEDYKPFRVVCTYAGEEGSTIGFHWYTKRNCESVVYVLETDGTRQYAGNGTTTKFQDYYAHSAVMSVEPNKSHAYRVGGDEQYSETGYFKSNPGRGKDFSFIVTGDAQASSEKDFAYSARTHIEAWEEFPEAAFSVILGDLTNDCSNAQWDMFFDAFAGVNANAALAPVAGNHDGNLKWNWFRHMFTLKEPKNFLSNLTGVYYSFDYGDVHIAVLNSNDMYPMTMMQQNWLLNDMKQSNANWKIVMMHRPPYTMGSHSSDPDTMLMRRVLIPLFDKAGVDLVMSGHDHVYARTKPMRGDKPAGEAASAYTDPGAAIYLLPGAACSKRYDIKKNVLPAIKSAMARSEQPGKPIFTGISIEGNTLTYQAYTYDPETEISAAYDELAITKTSFAGADPNYKPLPTDFLSCLPQQLWCFITGVPGLLGDYLFKLLPAVLGF